MNTQLEKKCNDFSEIMETLKKKYPSMDPKAAGFMSFLFTEEGKGPDREKLDDAQNGLNTEDCSFDMPGEILKYVLIAKAALSGDPAGFYDSMGEINSKIRGGKLFENGNELLAAMMLAEAGDKIDADKEAERIAQILKEMNKDHPILTNRNDTVSATLLSLIYPDKTPRQIADEVNACYKELRKKLVVNTATMMDMTQYMGEAPVVGVDVSDYLDNEIQAAAAIAAAEKGEPEEKCGKIKDLLDGLGKKDMVPDFKNELSLVSALAALPESAEAITADLAEADKYLAGKAGNWDASALMLLAAGKDKFPAASLLVPAVALLLAEAE